MDEKNKVFFLGGGPASLAGGLELVKKGYFVTILEREGKVGGISKTINYKGYRFDVGGHRFFTKSEEVMRLWGDILGDDFRKTPRLSRIYYNKKFFMYPIQIGDTFKKAGITTSLACLYSFVLYRLMPIRHEKSFADWVTNRFGKKLFNMFFLSYTEKVWGISTKILSADWAAQRIQGLSLWEVIKNAIFKPTNKAKTLIDEFYYPKYGSGMMYEKIAEKIESLGGKIIKNQQITDICLENGNVVFAKTKNQNGNEECFYGDHFVSSVPLPDTIRFIDPKIDSSDEISKHLQFRDFLSVNLIIDQKDLFPDNWIYVHDPIVKMGRIQNFKNFSPDMTPLPEHSPIGCEYFCNQGDILWNTSDQELIDLAKNELEKMGLIKKDSLIDGNVYRMRDAYPVYMDDYQDWISKAKKAIEPISNLQAIGRGGMFRYNNMDHSILSGIFAARNIMGDNLNLWEINEEKEYHEIKK